MLLLNLLMIVKSITMQLNKMKRQCLIMTFMCFAGLMTEKSAVADVVLPSVDPKFVTLVEKNPTRDAGYVVGDVLSRTVTITIKKPYELVKESLPIVGYEHRYKGQISGIELTNIQHQEHQNVNSVTHELNLSYQVFTTGRVAKPAALRAEILKLRNTDNKDVVQLRVPSFSFRVSPLSVYGQVKLREEMSPFVPPLLLDATKEKRNIKILAGVLALSLLGLLYMLGVHAWLPKMGAPFAKAYRDIRKMPDTAEGMQQAVARIHQSLNKTAGTSVFKNTIDEFLNAKPAFKVAKQEIEQFFETSRQVFFESEQQQKSGIQSKAQLMQFCRHMRDCERGLKPDVANNNSVSA